MHTFFRFLTAAIVIAVVGGSAVTGAHAAMFFWNNPDGGAWDVPANWGAPTYPNFFFDFADFSLDATYAVQATDPARVSLVAGLSVRNGAVTLTTHDAFRALLLIGDLGQPAALTLAAGAVDGMGTHMVGPDGTLIVAAGARITSASSGPFGFQVQDGGVLGGSGVLAERSVRSFGTVAPGGAGATGALTVLAGGYEQRDTGVLAIEIGGAGHDQLVLDAPIHPVMLAGTLTVTLLDDASPADGDRYELLIAPGYQGAFATVTLPDVPGFSFDVAYEADRVVMTTIGTAASAPEIAFDIQPGGCTGTFNTGKQGVVPAAVLGAGGFDVADIDVTSLALEGVAPLRSGMEDVASPGAGDDCPCSGDADGIDDLTLKFSAPDLAAAIPDAEDGSIVSLTLTGVLVDGTPFEAADCVRIKAGNPKADANRGRKKEVDADATTFRVWSAAGSDARSPRIAFSLPESAPVSLAVYTVTGRRVLVTEPRTHASGTHEVGWSADGLASGIYFVRVQAGAIGATVKQRVIR